MLFRFLGFKGFCLSRFSKETQRADGGIVGAQASGDARALRRLVSFILRFAFDLAETNPTCDPPL